MFQFIKGAEAVAIADYLQEGSVCLVLKNKFEIEKVAASLRFFYPGLHVLKFEPLDNEPYEAVSASNEILAQRIKTLITLASIKEKFIVITAAEAFCNKIPAREFICRNMITVNLGDELSFDLLQEHLLQSGFKRKLNAIQSGEYAVRGGILDIVIENKGYRIDLLGDKVEAIRCFDTDSQTTIGKVSSLSIHPLNEIIITPQSIEIFKQSYLKNYGASFGQFYDEVVGGIKVQGLEWWISMFYENLESLLSYLPNNIRLLLPEQFTDELQDFEIKVKEQYILRKDRFNNPKDLEPVAPNQLFYMKEQIEKELELCNPVIYKYGSTDNIKPITSFAFDASAGKVNPLEVFKEFIAEQKDKIIYLACHSIAAVEKIAHQLKDIGIQYTRIDNIALANRSLKLVNLIELSLDNGFATLDSIFVSEKDIWREKSAIRTRVRKPKKRLITELNALVEEDLVVHQEHGIGRYKGIEELNALGVIHDFIKLIYRDGDKLYIPVENLELISKYGLGEAELDKLGAIGWQTRKAKLKKRIKLAAEKLLAIAAARALINVEPINLDKELFQEFCDRFPYVETDDQLSAIEDVIEDLCKEMPMDRLVCGDVGFGKTEVALRAAFLVASNLMQKQVAVLVPTTLLARQHYKTFKERFAGIPIRIAQLSKFTPANQIKRIKQELAEGKIDIIIGTHALLAKDVKFNNLGMLIIDEEQHFGVAQKEKLKEIKAGTHVLTLSATPIPRTLQMSLVGIRELSLITTPPMERLSIKTAVMPFDRLTIRDAVTRELTRGGRAFVVTPRVKYLSELFVELTEMLPEASIIIASGQMTAVKLDEIMNHFYDGKYNVLISTTIIESGLDIPNANTIIIDRSHMFGLAQLYQMRGRVGRGKEQAYAYFTVPRTMRVSPIAQRRMEVMQSVDYLGAGFSIASHDMDIRGYGNLVGDEQSGHIKEVGIELYQQMLEEAVLSLKTNQDQEISDKWSPILNLGVSVQIPESYIPDSSLRLTFYRRIASVVEDIELESLHLEMQDRFGELPESVLHLLEIIKLKQLAIHANIEKMDLGDKGLLLMFRKSKPASFEKILELVTKNAGTVKLRADNKLFFNMLPKEHGALIASITKLLKELI